MFRYKMAYSTSNNQYSIMLIYKAESYNHIILSRVQYTLAHVRIYMYNAD